MVNSVILIGFVSKPPRRVPGGYVFPLAVYRDPHRDPVVVGDREIPDFPPVMVLFEGDEGTLPPFVRHKALVRVEGFVRTRNRDEPLRVSVRRDARRAGVSPETIEQVLALLPENAVVKRVEVEVVAEKILPEGG